MVMNSGCTAYHEGLLFNAGGFRSGGDGIWPAIVDQRLRALCNGKTSAFQADDAGSIPAARLIQNLKSVAENFVFNLFDNDIKSRYNTKS